MAGNSEESDASVSTMMTITGIGEEEARYRLQLAKGNMQEAISCHFDGFDGSRIYGPRNDGIRHRNTTNQEINRIANASCSGIVDCSTWADGGIYGYVLSGARLISSIIWSTTNFLASVIFSFWGLPHLSMLERVEKKYGRFHPEFFISSLNQAMEKSLRERKLLIVFLHSEISEDSVQVWRNVICTQAFSAAVEGHGIFWVSEKLLPNDRRMGLYRTRSFPSLSFFYIQDMDTVEQFGHLEGLFTLDEAVAKLMAAIDQLELKRNTNSIPTSTEERNRRLRDEQDREYQEAIRQDLARMAKAEQESQRKLLEQQEKMEIENEKKAQQEKLVAHRKLLAQAFRCENQELSGTESITQISVRLPQGAKFTRIFSLHDSVQRLYNWVDALPELDISVSHDTIPMDFTLLVTIPRKILNDKNMTLQVAGLYPSAVITIDDRKSVHPGVT